MDSTNKELFNLMKKAFEVLQGNDAKTRELSLVKTKLEEAMMWLNKHRTIIGELEKNKTHIDGK